MTTKTLTNREGDTWTETLDPGQFTISATTTSGVTMTGTGVVALRAGQTARLPITLQPGTLVARAFIVSFRFNSAFLEPCMRPVLREVVARARANPNERLLIVGHSDKSGSAAANQALSERRARAVFAYLTAGREQAASLSEWTALRTRRGGAEVTTLSDSWDVREYQQMLQDLEFYPGGINGRDDRLTQEAVRAFRCSVGLPPGPMDDPAWSALIRGYMAQDALELPAASLFTNCGAEPLKWVGCGEESPVPTPHPTRGGAFRPYRRVELLFVNATTLPCQIPQPDTFNLPSPGSVGTGWCLGPGNATRHCCFGTRDCATADSQHWCIEPVEAQTLALQGRIQREVIGPDGSTSLVPATGVQIVLVTPDGEFKQAELASGEPVPARTRNDGTFSFPNVRAGTTSLEVRPPAIVRLTEDGPEHARGPTVCKRIAAAGDRLDVVIQAAPVLRQIRLPVVAHLMTALNATTRAIRTCPEPLNPTVRVPQRTSRTRADVQALIDGANRIWSQARVTFELVDVVEEVFAHFAQPECAVDENEFGQILLGGAYPDVVNAYFFGTLQSTGEAGVRVKADLQDTTTQAIIDSADGVAMGDRVLMQLFANAPPFPIELRNDEPLQVLAHEFGHYLELDHVTGQHRLMIRNVDQTNRLLVTAEIDRARSSPNAGEQCRPVSLRVNGATRVGSPRSGLFLAPVAAGSVVTIDAVISPELLANGTLVFDGGDAGVGATQRLVRVDRPSVTKVKATYRPTGGGPVSTTFARIIVTSFRLAVGGATQVPGRPDEFLVRRAPAGVVTISAVLDREPECLTRDLVTWAGGVEDVDPLRRTLSGARVARTTVSATVGGVTRSVTIIVADVAITAAQAPFAPVPRVVVEGVSNRDLPNLSLAALSANQRPSLFIGRAELPGLTSASIPAALTSTAVNGSVIETRNVTLTRTAVASDVFSTLPVVVLPVAIPRSEITLHSPPNLEAIRGVSGGTITLRVPGLFVSLAAQAGVRARTVRIFSQVFRGSGAAAADARRQIAVADRIWAQAGIEISARSVTGDVVPPAGLVKADGKLRILHTDDTGINLTTDEQQLVGTRAPSPARSSVTTDLNLYYVAELQGPPSGIAFPNTTVMCLEAPTVTDKALAHEVGHHLIVNWGGEEHQDHTGHDWPRTNILHSQDTGDGVDLDRTQIDSVVVNEASIPIIVRQP